MPSRTAMRGCRADDAVVGGVVVFGGGGKALREARARVRYCRIAGSSAKLEVDGRVSDDFGKKELRRRFSGV